MACVPTFFAVPMVLLTGCYLFVHRLATNRPPGPPSAIVPLRITRSISLNIHLITNHFQCVDQIKNVGILFARERKINLNHSLDYTVCFSSTWFLLSFGPRSQPNVCIHIIRTKIPPIIPLFVPLN